MHPEAVYLDLEAETSRTGGSRINVLANKAVVAGFFSDSPDKAHEMGDLFISKLRKRPDLIALIPEVETRHQVYVPELTLLMREAYG